MESIQAISNGLIFGAVYALIAIGLTMIFGIMNVVNFAHGEFYMLGGFFSYYLVSALRLNFFLSILVSLVLVMIFGFVCERLILSRLRDASISVPMLAMIGLSIFLKNTMLLVAGPFPKKIETPFSPGPILVGPFALSRPLIFSVLLSLAIILSIHLFMKRTRTGKAIRAVFQEREASALVGIDIEKIHSFTFAFGVALAGIAGTLLGAIFYVYPTMGSFAIVKAFVISIMGGMGSFVGAILGGLILGVSENLATIYVSSGYKDAVGFGIIILVLLFKPSGLFGKL